MDDHLLPDGTPVRILEEVHLVEDDDAEVVECGRSGVDHVAQHFRRHHHRRRITVDGVVAGQQPDFAGAVAVGEVAELLVGQCLQRRRVEGPSSPPAHHLDAVLGDDRLAAAGRCGDDDVAASVDGVDGLELEAVELERVSRHDRRARLAHARELRRSDPLAVRRPPLSEQADAGGDEVEHEHRPGQGGQRDRIT